MDFVVTRRNIEVVRRGNKSVGIVIEDGTEQGIVYPLIPVRVIHRDEINGEDGKGTTTATGNESSINRTKKRWGAEERQPLVPCGPIAVDGSAHGAIEDFRTPTRVIYFRNRSPWQVGMTSSARDARDTHDERRTISRRDTGCQSVSINLRGIPVNPHRSIAIVR